VFYVGGIYEVQGGTVTKYYYAAGQRVAMRKNGAVTYLHGDHLGSTSLATDASGQPLARVLYYPYGEERYQDGTLPTDYTYTGQRVEESLGGLMDYNARYYDPALGRFVSADTIVPGTGSQAQNRYMYVNGNPLKYVDPSGHRACLSWDESGRCTAWENPATGEVTGSSGGETGKETTPWYAPVVVGAAEVWRWADSTIGEFGRSLGGVETPIGIESGKGVDLPTINFDSDDLGIPLFDFKFGLKGTIRLQPNDANPLMIVNLDDPTIKVTDGDWKYDIGKLGIIHRDPTIWQHADGSYSGVMVREEGVSLWPTVSIYDGCKSKNVFRLDDKQQIVVNYTVKTEVGIKGPDALILAGAYFLYQIGIAPREDYTWATQ
jgi:RHS repeat-associated protein